MPLRSETFHKKQLLGVILVSYMGTPTEKQRIGAIGEDIAATFLVKHGFSVISRNYRKKYGEIDIICEKDGMLHFVEVKTVSRENVSRETSDSYQAEENIHEAKLKRLGRTIEAYLLEFDREEEWMFHAVIVLLDKKAKVAKVRFLKDLII